MQTRGDIRLLRRPASRSVTVVAVSALLTGVMGAGPLAVEAEAATVVADWRMEDTTRTMLDSSAAQRHGTSTSNVQLLQPGSSGYGYRFTKSPSYVTVPSSTAFDPGTSAFTVSARVKFTSLPPGGDVNTFDIVRKGVVTTAGGDWKLEIMRGGQAHCLFRGDAGQAEVFGSANLADGRWHTLTCRRTSDGVTLIVDGTAKTSARRTGAISNSKPVILGAKNTRGHDQYKGYLDEVSIIKG